MIISIRPIDTLYPVGTFLDSVEPVALGRHSLGEKFYPSGGKIKLAGEFQVVQVVESRGPDIVERYCLTEKELSKSAPQWLHQVQVKVIPGVYGSDRTVEVFTDRAGLMKLFPKISLDFDTLVTPNYLSDILMQLVVDELIDMDCLTRKQWLDHCFGVVGSARLPMLSSLRIGMSRQLNRLSLLNDMQPIDPTQMALWLGEYGTTYPPGSGYEYILHDLMDTFIPNFCPLVPTDQLTALNWNRPGITLRDLSERVGGTPLNQDTPDTKHSHKLPPLTSELFSLIDTISQIRFTDFYLEYISPNCKEVNDSEKVHRLRQLFPAEVVERMVFPPKLRVATSEFGDRYGLRHPKLATDLQYSFHKECEPILEEIGRLLTEVFHGVRSATLWKTFNNWVYIEVTTDQGTERYGLDLTWLSLVSPNLTYLW